MTADARAGALGQARAAEATAHTLNYALGTRHKKSWMAAPPAEPAGLSGHAGLNPLQFQPRKRGRPPKVRTPNMEEQQHATEAANATNAPPAERLPSSNSTSPQLANIVTNHPQDRSQSRANVIVLPSPTPSEEDEHRATVPTSRPNNEVVNSAQRRSPHDFCTPLGVPMLDSITQHYSAPKRPAGESLAPMEKRARVDSAAQGSTTNAAPSANLTRQAASFPRQPPAPHTNHGYPLMNQPPSRRPSDTHPHNNQIASPQFMETAQHWGYPPNLHSSSYPVQGHTMGQPLAPIVFTDPSLQRHPHGADPSVQQTLQPQHSLPSQRRSSNDDWYTRQICTQILHNFKASQPIADGYLLDGERLNVLEEAIRTQDWAYLTLHQFYCVSSYQSRCLPQRLYQNPNLGTAHALMRDVLGDNAQISMPFQRLFCNFPFPIGHIASTWPVRYRHLETEFLAFVNQSLLVVQLRDACERRRVPPTLCEFARYAITSSTFRHLFLRSVIRSLWNFYPQGPIRRQLEEEAIRAFLQAMNPSGSHLSSRTLSDPFEAETQLYAGRGAFNYVTEKFQAALEGQGYVRLNPAVPSGYVQPSQTNLTPTDDNMAMPRQHQQPPPSTTHHRTPSHMHSPSRSRHTVRSLLPAPGVNRPQQREPNPSRYSLHQAHLRSPVLKIRNIASPVFYFWQGFVSKPAKLVDANNAIEKVSFKLSDKEIKFVSTALPTARGAPAERLIDEDRKVIRLRCVKWPSDQPVTDEAWAVSAHSWIPHAFFTFNGTPLELRKKLHNGKDLPSDLTELVREGQNVLEVTIMSDSDDITHRDYYVAIEFLGIMTREAIQETCRTNRIPAQETLNAIKRKLSVGIADDDDIAIVETTLTVNLRDPFSATKICDVPVRSTACLHNECFDLDTFLDTRPSKGNVSTADQWRCPICKADARPCQLVIDDFLVGVRNELEKNNLLDTRAIIVDQNGAWTPKPEERDPNGVQDCDTPDPISEIPAFHEIIDLDSD